MCMSIKDFMSPEQLEKYNSSDFTPQPSLGGTECQGNGQHEGIEIQCDECDYFLECYPEYDLEVSPEDIELFNEAVRSLDSVLCKIQDKYGDEVMLLSCEDAIILVDRRNNRKEELSVIYTKGKRDIEEIEIKMVNAIDD